MGIQGQGRYMTLAKGQSDFKIKTCFSRKPLCHLKPNFIWKLMHEWKWKFIQMSWVTWPRWSPCPYMIKTFKNHLLQNQRTDGLGTWFVTLGIQVLLKLFKMWPWVDLDLFYGKVKYGKMQIHRISLKVLQSLAWKLANRVVLMSTWRFVSRRGQGHCLTFDPGLS